MMAMYDSSMSPTNIHTPWLLRYVRLDHAYIHTYPLLFLGMSFSPNRHAYIPDIPLYFSRSVCFPRTYIHTSPFPGMYVPPDIPTRYVCFPGHTYIPTMLSEVCMFGPCIHTYIHTDIYPYTFLGLYLSPRHTYIPLLFQVCMFPQTYLPGMYVSPRHTYIPLDVLGMYVSPDIHTYRTFPYDFSRSVCFPRHTYIPLLFQVCMFPQTYLPGMYVSPDIHTYLRFFWVCMFPQTYIHTSNFLGMYVSPHTHIYLYHTYIPIVSRLFLLLGINVAPDIHTYLYIFSVCMFPQRYIHTYTF